MIERNKINATIPREVRGAAGQIHRQPQPGLSSFEIRRREPGIHDLPLSSDLRVSQR